MRLADCYLDLLLHVRRLARSGVGQEPEALRATLNEQLAQCASRAQAAGFTGRSADAARFAAVAFIDEQLLTAAWPGKLLWQKQSLQREHYNMTNAGAEFYQKLNALDKSGADLDAREVFYLCLALGFRGRYFSGDDWAQLEETKGFNLRLLLPADALQALEQGPLFSAAYGTGTGGGFNPRRAVWPWLIGVPAALLAILLVSYHLNIAGHLRALAALVG